MGTQQKRKFTNAIWVKGMYKGEEVIGRTIIYNNHQCVSLVTELGNRQTVPFDSITDIVKLSFVKKIMPPISTRIQLKKSQTKIEKLILTTLVSINKIQSN